MYTLTFFAVLLMLSGIQAAPLPSGLPCPVDNAIICSADGKSFSKCNWGVQVPNGPVAAGTTCVNGEIVAINGAEPEPIATSTTMATTIVTATPTASPTPSNTTPPAISTPESETLTTTTLLETLKSTSIVFQTMTKSSTSERQTSTYLSTVTVDVTTTMTRSSSSSTASAPVVTTSETTAAPSSIASATPTSTTSGNDITAQQLLAIAPKSSTCDGAQFADECATADHAVSYINDAFTSFGLTTKGEKAAVLSIMAFESGEFKFNINHYPGTPGQGTRNMMNFPFILSYVNSIPSLASSVPAGTTADNASDDVKNTVRALVLDDAHTFATGAWFLSTQCSDEVKNGLKNGVDEAAWDAYITSCVGTTVTDDRKSYWTAAVAAL